MNRSESKYFNTAKKMDAAFLALLEKKDFEYITVKEICELAGVNRSTFYLHYETLGDLLEESVQYIISHFQERMSTDAGSFIEKLKACPSEELYLVTPQYLLPYLGYIKENRRLFGTAVKNAAVLRLDKAYAGLFRHVLTPILERFGVPEERRGYMLAFYMNGLIAIINEWLKNDCNDSAEYIADIMQGCVLPKHEQK